MIVHSLIKKDMAKEINQEKIERIREAAIELIFEKGYGGASILSIANKAKVSSGYLYRFYKSKYELVSDLLSSLLLEILREIEFMLNDGASVEQISERLIDFLFDKAKHKPYHIRFIYSLITEHKFKMGLSERNKILKLCKQMLETGHKLNSINKNYKEEEVFLMIVIYPIEYINLRFKYFFSKKSLTEQDKKRIHRLCINALKH